MDLQPKNYHTEGGNKWVVNGDLEFGPDATVEGLPSGGAVTWDSITDKPAVIGAGATQAAARTAIGLGALSTLSAITTTQITDGTITNADINAAAAIALTKLANVAAGTDGLAAGTLQATLQALATRIQALEAAP